MREKLFCLVLVVLWCTGLAVLCLNFSIWAAILGWLLSMLFAALLLIGEEEPELILEPLTLEAAGNGDDICWLETRNGYYVEPCLVGNDCTTHPGKRPIYFIGQEAENTPWFDDADYGIYWRCWADRPTDEDKKAAPWEGEL